jgi:hypothetical protein
MHKADLWRLCKLYVNGGVYADVDLVPYLNIDTVLEESQATFYSCSSCFGGVFQAFMISKSPKNPMLFLFLLSFLMNHPHLKRRNGPTHDMYWCIKYNIGFDEVLPEKKYDFDQFKIKIFIGSSETNVKEIDLHFFPEGFDYEIRLVDNPYKDVFEIWIKNNLLFVKRLDEETGWGFHHSIDICIACKESVFLFKENIGENEDWVTSYVTLGSNKILDSRDLDYHKNGGWV